MAKADAKKTGRARPSARSSSNPKDLQARNRVPMWSLPAIGAVHGAQATCDGIDKYGPYNWREQPISLLEYIGAMERHIAALKDGEWFTQDNPTVTHLGCINANTAIILDAHQCGTLIDDRPEVPGHAGDELERFKQEKSNGAGAKRTDRNRQRG